MNTGTACLALLSIGLSLALPASAQLTVSTDRPEYQPGEIVRITIHNGGPSVAHFVSEPPLTVVHVATDDCCYGCVGLPVLFDLAPGATISSMYDTASCGSGNLVGEYLVTLAGASGDPGSVLTATFLVLDAIQVEPVGWGAVKGRFR